ncbi:MAG: hypothetical protein CSA74_08280 [Rhodobacterales bacterium]|nr:MAG: hypothetical protein CSA74_08280 [Rhodobacterales bacterium]
MAAAAVLFAATAVLLLHNPGQQASGQSRGQSIDLLDIPKEVTPEIVAMRGCLEQVAHPSGAKIDPAAQLAACNDWVRLAPDDTQARYFRGIHLHPNVRTDADRETVFADMTAVIECCGDNPTAFYRRAFLQMTYRKDPDAAMADINQAIALTEDRPRARYYEFRAALWLEMAPINNDPEAARAALEDARKALALNPTSEVVPKIESLARQMLDDFARKGKDAGDPAAATAARPG